MPCLSKFGSTPSICQDLAEASRLRAIMHATKFLSVDWIIMFRHGSEAPDGDTSSQIECNARVLMDASSGGRLRFQSSQAVHQAC